MRIYIDVDLKKRHLVSVIFLGMIILGMFLIFIVPKTYISADEQRELSKMPKFTAETVFDGQFSSGVNTYLNDHFPFRDMFVNLGHEISALMNHHIGNGAEIISRSNTGNDNSAGDLIMYNKRAMEVFRYEYPSLMSYAAAVNKVTFDIKDMVPYTTMYSMIVPTATEFYSPENFHIGSRSQKEATEKMNDMLAEEITPIDVYSPLSAMTDEYIYFNTDHHWTVRGAYQGYLAFCKAAGLEPFVPEKEYTVKGDFLGTFYYSSKNKKLKTNPDYVEVYLPPEIEDCIGYAEYHNGELKVPYDVAALVDPDETESNKYKVFLGGDAPLFRIISPNKNGRRLLIIRDSYSNAMALFFAANYEEIFLLDPRLLTVDAGAFCKKYLVTDVLFENYATVLKNDGMASLITKLGE